MGDRKQNGPGWEETRGIRTGKNHRQKSGPRGRSKERASQGGPELRPEDETLMVERQRPPCFHSDRMPTMIPVPSYAMVQPMQMRLN